MRLHALGAGAELLSPLALALVLRVALAVAVPVAPTWDGVVYVRAAEQLAQGQGFTHRILGEGNMRTPTAFYPVGYPAVLALVRLVGGGWYADRLLQALAGTLLVPIAYLLGRRAHGRAAGRAAAWVAALWPGQVLLSASWFAEPLFALSTGLALMPLVYARRRRFWPALALSAAALGVSAYVRPTALVIALCTGLGAAWHHARAQARARRAISALGGCALALAMAILPLVPWAARNVEQLGAPVLVSTNGGVNLLLGARDDGAFRPLSSDAGCRSEELGEVERDRCFTRIALSEIASAPLAWLGRGLVKVAHTFGHESAPAQSLRQGLQLAPERAAALELWALGLCRLGWLAVLAAALAGARRLLSGRPSLARVSIVAPVAALCLLHFSFLSGDRYHAGVAAAIAALAGIGLARCPARAPRTAPPR